MIEGGPATEHDMVLAFLRAEIDSPRFGDFVHRCLGMLRSDRALIDNANVGDAGQNHLRRELLGCFRGFGKDAFLFTGFPQNVTWRRVVLDANDLRTLRYANEPSWIEFSDGTRLVAVGAANAHRRSMGQGALTLAKEIRRGAGFPELIAVQAEGTSLIVVEGHTRATAYLLADSSAVAAIVGCSIDMPRWAFY